VGIHARGLGGDIGVHAHHPPADLIGELEGHQVKVAAGPAQQGIGELHQRWYHQVVTPTVVKIEKATAQALHLKGPAGQNLFDTLRQ
jgi:hypothetical protein